MEEHLGRPLSDDEVVHHLDGDRQNNDISNLRLFSNQAEHHRFEMEQRGSVTNQYGDWPLREEVL